MGNVTRMYKEYARIYVEFNAAKEDLSQVGKKYNLSCNETLVLLSAYEHFKGEFSTVQLKKHVGLVNNSIIQVFNGLEGRGYIESVSVEAGKPKVTKLTDVGIAAAKSLLDD